MEEENGLRGKLALVLWACNAVRLGEYDIAAGYLELQLFDSFKVWTGRVKRAL